MMKISFVFSDFGIARIYMKSPERGRPLPRRGLNFCGGNVYIFMIYLARERRKAAGRITRLF
jgi:hypothetical protein